MLDLIQWLANRLAPLRAGLIALTLVAALVGVLALTLLDPGAADSILLPALILLLWSVMGIVFIDLFAKTLDARTAGRADAGRLRHRLVRGFQWFLALGFLLLGLVAIDLSLSIAREWIDETSLVDPGTD
jgi:nitrogen fixation/metabolism regulation signal transduction histidine kinase